MRAANSQAGVMSQANLGTGKPQVCSSYMNYVQSYPTTHYLSGFFFFSKSYPIVVTELYKSGQYYTKWSYNNVSKLPNVKQRPIFVCEVFPNHNSNLNRQLTQSKKHIVKE